MGNTRRSGVRTAARVLTTVILLMIVAVPFLAADEISMRIDGGRVTLSATDARLADVLAAWSRVGDTRFVGAQAIGGELITLHLVDAGEAEAIHLLLRSAAGYVAAPRRAGAAGASRYDRVTIMATRGLSSVPTRPGRGAAVTAPPPATYDPGQPSPDAPALVRMEELQRLLDAAADSGGAPSDGLAPTAPVVTTPFPGVGSDPGSSPLPDRWQRPRRPR